MKANKLTVKNIGMVADATIELNKPLILLYGEIRQGKTTLLNAVKWVFGGPFPADIIRHGEAEATLRLDLDCGSITRSWYVARDGATKSRAVVFEKDGVAVKDPVAEIKKFLNPFLLDQSYLANMTELERKKYFVQLFSVNTQEIDQQITSTEASAVAARVMLKAYGDIDTTPVPQPPDVRALQDSRARIIALHAENQAHLHGELAERRKVYQSEVNRVNAVNVGVRRNNQDIDLGEAEAKRIAEEITTLTQRIARLQADLTDKTIWLSTQKRQQIETLPPMPYTEEIEKKLGIPPDTSVVDAQISEAMVAQLKWEQYQKACERQKDREKDEACLLGLEATVRELRAKRIAKLKSISESTGIPGLEFDEAGNFLFEGSSAGMLSTSQLMRLSVLLSGLYPEGFGIELLDRGESLGKSIFEFVDRAKEENKTILATIVGERPATVPQEIGVFIVSGGCVSV